MRKPRKAHKKQKSTRPELLVPSLRQSWGAPQEVQRKLWSPIGNLNPSGFSHIQNSSVSELPKCVSFPCVSASLLVEMK